jgi:hypothetical protein
MKNKAATVSALFFGIHLIFLCGVLLLIVKNVYNDLMFFGYKGFSMCMTHETSINLSVVT